MGQRVSNGVISANNVRDEDCEVVGGWNKKDGTDKVHDKGVPRSTGGPNIYHSLVITVKEEFLPRPLVAP